MVSQLKPEEAGISRNRLVSFLLEELLAALERFEARRIRRVQPRVAGAGPAAGKRIQLEQNGLILAGVAHGVDKNGGLLLETAGAGIQVFHSGEVSIHRG